MYHNNNMQAEKKQNTRLYWKSVKPESVWAAIDATLFAPA